MSLDLDNRVYGALLGIWLGFVLNTTPFSLVVAFSLVSYIFFLMFFLKRSFMSGARLLVRLGIHSITMVFCCLLVPALKEICTDFLPVDARIPQEKLLFLVIIVAFWIASHELERLSRGDPAYVWIEERGEFSRR